MAAAVAGAGAGAGLELELAAAGSVGSMQRQQQRRCSVGGVRGGMPVLVGNPGVSFCSGSGCRALALSAVTVYTCAGFPAPFAFGAAEPACCVILRVPQGALGGGREWFAVGMNESFCAWLDSASCLSCLHCTAAFHCMLGWSAGHVLLRAAQQSLYALCMFLFANSCVSQVVC